MQWTTDSKGAYVHVVVTQWPSAEEMRRSRAAMHAEGVWRAHGRLLLDFRPVAGLPCPSAEDFGTWSREWDADMGAPSRVAIVTAAHERSGETYLRARDQFHLEAEMAVFLTTETALRWLLA